MSGPATRGKKAGNKVASGLRCGGWAGTGSRGYAAGAPTTFYAHNLWAHNVGVIATLVGIQPVAVAHDGASAAGVERAGGGAVGQHAFPATSCWHSNNPPTHYHGFQARGLWRRWAIDAGSLPSRWGGGGVARDRRGWWMHARTVQRASTSRRPAHLSTVPSESPENTQRRHLHPSSTGRSSRHQASMQAGSRARKEGGMQTLHACWTGRRVRPGQKAGRHQASRHQGTQSMHSSQPPHSRRNRAAA